MAKSRTANKRIKTSEKKLLSPASNNFADSLSDNNLTEFLDKVLSQDIIKPTENPVLYELSNKEFKIHMYYEDLRTDLRTYYEEKVKVDFDAAKKICLDTVSQKNEKWFVERRKRLTGSVGYQFITATNNKKTDWEDKIKRHLNNTFKGNSATRHGIFSEPKAIEVYEKLKNKKVTKPGLLINPCIPWLGYSPDGVLEDRIIEVKSPVSGKDTSGMECLKKLPYLNKNEENLSLKEKHAYYFQLQIGMFITGLKLADFIIFCSFDNSLTIFTTEYNATLVNTYLTKLRYVYFYHLLPALVEDERNLKS